MDRYRQRRLGPKSLIYVLILSLVGSCQDDPAPRFERMSFYGEWDSTEVEFHNSPSNCTVYEVRDKLVFYPRMLFWYRSDSTSCYPTSFSSGMTMDYTYDDINTIATEIKVNYKIIQLGGGTMKIEQHSSTGKSATITYRQVCQPIGAMCRDTRTIDKMSIDICGPTGVVKWTCK